MEKFKITLGDSGRYGFRVYEINEIKIGHFVDGGIRVDLYGEYDGYQEHITTINKWLSAPPVDGAVWLKSYAENNGLRESLQELGYIELTGRCAVSGYTVLEEARFTGALRDEIENQLSPVFKGDFGSGVPAHGASAHVLD